MISASVGVNSSLLLEPAQTLTFALGASPASPAKAKTSRACLTLTNISPRKRVVYKVRTTNVDMFVVKPAQGVIEPSSDVAIVITLTPPACERLLRMTPDDRAAIVERFLIQSIDRSDDMRGFSVDDLATFWKRLPKELITNKKLTCKFMDARDVEPGVLSSLQRLRLPSDEPIVEDHLSSSMHQYNRQPPPPPPSPPSRGNQDDQAPRGGSVSPPLRQGRQVARTPPIAMNLPSSPVPSLRPKTATPSQPTAFLPNSYLSEGSEDSYSVNGDGHGDVDLDLDSGFSGVSHGSNDSYATRKKAEAEFPEIIESEDRLEYRLHPSESLVFPVHHAYPDDAERGIVEGKSYFFITNKARHSGLAFKIKTSHHTGYFVKPARGFIDAKTAQRVDVFVNAPDAARFNARDREMKDRFLVELLFIPPSQSIELWAMPEERKRQQLQVVWDASKAADRRQAVLTCQILEEDTPIDPTHQTAEQARALLSKSQAAALHNKSSNSLRQDSSGESANPWVHPPLSPAMHTPRGNQYQHQNQQFYQQQQQPRSPVMPQARSPAHQQPRSPARPQPRSPVQPRSPSVPPPGGRSPVRQPPPPQPYYNHRKEAMPPNVPWFDDDRTYYA